MARFNLGGAGAGALGGFAAGGAIGSVPGAGIGLVAGGLLGGLGMFDEDQKEDPLADIRNQLQGLASDVPGLIERRKKQIRELFGETREKGLQDIAEEFQAERGLGMGSTPETARRAEFMEDIARALAEKELEAEFGGLELQAGLLGKASGIQVPKEGPTFGEQLFATGGQLLGKQLQAKSFADIIKQGQEAKKSTPQEILRYETKKRPSVLTQRRTTSPRLELETADIFGR